MSCLGIHFCSDELFMLMMAVPFLGIYGRRLSVWWHSRCECPSHEHQEGHEE